jgi:titin
VATTWTDNTVLPSKTYSYRVNFVNGVNASAQVLTAASTQVGVAVGAPSSLVANLDLQNLRNTLTWIDNADNETSFVVERSVDGVNFSQIATPSAMAATGGIRTASDTAIAPGVVYTYRVKAVNVVGTVTNSSGWNTNGAQAVDMRIAKPVVAAVAPTSTATVLTWTESNPWVTSYDVYRSSDNGTTWALLGNTTAKTYTDNAMANLVPENAYQYRVSAKWLYNTVTYPQVANDASTVGVTTAPATLAMAAPANVTSALAGLNRVTVGWADNANNETAYEVYRSANGGAYTLVGTPAHTGGTNGGTVTFTDTSASTLGDSYTYQVRAVKVATGNVAGAITPTAAAETRYSAMSAASATPLLYAVPPMPVPVADIATARQITISWTPVDRATGYIIERQRLATVLDPVAGTSAATAQAWALQNTVTGGTSASWTNTGLAYGRMYQYRVRATSVLGDSSVNTSANVTAAVIVK